MGVSHSMVNGRVYDCFIFFNELDLLEIRLNELDEVVDKFVLVESTRTFSGKEKQLFYLNNKHLFEKFNHKIIHVIVDDMPDTPDRWERERFQRNAIVRGLTHCQPDDIILISDVDEIPNKHRIGGNVSSRFKVFTQKNYYYFINCLSNIEWYGTVMVRFKDLVEIHVLKLSKNNFEKIADGGWHFSFLGDVETIRTKIESFSHSEADNDYYKNPAKLLEHINKGTDLFDRPGVTYQFVPVDNTYPAYLRDNLDRFNGLIKTINELDAEFDPYSKIDEMYRGGLECWEKGEREQGLEMVFGALEADPDKKGVLDTVTEMATKLNNYEVLERSFREYLTCHPADLNVLASLADTLLHLGKLDEAEEELKKVLIFDPENAPALSVMSRLMSQKGRQVTGNS